MADSVIPNPANMYTFIEKTFILIFTYMTKFFFFISRVLGASFRLFLVAIVLQQFVFDAFGRDGQA